MFEQLKQNKQFFILLVMAFVMTLVLFGVALISLLSPQSSPSSQTSPYLKTIVGRTKEDAVESLPKKKNVQTLSDNTKQYSFATRNLVRDDIIVTKDNAVIFEKTITVTDSLVHPKTSALVAQYGTPERIIHGEKTYGSRVDVYIYASKGIAFIGRTYTDEVLEIHQFAPMSVDEYVSTWGKDAGYEEPEHFHP